MQTDYLIIGQGISGTLLSRELMRAGKRVMVIDDGNPSSSSKVASGIINPVTGKRLVKTWLIDELLPFVQDIYTAIGNELGTSLITQCNILDFHMAQDAATIFHDKKEIDPQYLHNAAEQQWAGYFRFNYGIGEIDHCLLIDVNTLLAKWREHLVENNSLIQTRFNWQQCKVEEGGVSYQEITADKIILCDGAAAADDPYFNRLPWSKDKGEALIVSIPGLPQTSIYKRGINIVPWRDDLFWVGATHDWKFTDLQPTEAFRKQTEEQLHYWLKLPYKVIDHLVGRRPVNVERKPFVGLHPLHPSVGIFNGMGTKGCSVAPYFALQFANHLISGQPLMPDVDVKRFTKILSR